jgi:hypothetical protein
MIQANRFPPLNETSSLASLLVFIISNAYPESLKKAGQYRLLEIAHYLLSNVNSASLVKQEQKKQSIPLPEKRPRTNTMIPRNSSGQLTMVQTNNIKADKTLMQVHTGIIQFIFNKCQISPIDKPEPLVSLTYHMILSKIDESLFSVLCGMNATMIKYFSPSIFTVSAPPLSKVLWKRIQILRKSANTTSQEARIIAQPFKALFETDFEKTVNNNRSAVIAMRALSLLNEEESVHPSLLLIFEAFDDSKIQS